MNHVKYNNDSYNKRVVEMKKALRNVITLIVFVSIIKVIINLIV
jgi:hypothetical protein